jgi:hypothetical protein
MSRSLARLPAWAVLLAFAGYALPTGLFLYWVFGEETTSLGAALRDPLVLAFLVDVLLTLAVLAVFFAKYPLGRYRWPWLVGLSLATTLCFGLALYWWLNERERNVRQV